MASIDDVARLAGVSTATVSRALRGVPTVTEQTRARVAAAAASLGYAASPRPVPGTAGPDGGSGRHAANIDDVAKLAGVSTATVSRALRGSPAVTEPTRERVTAAAAALGYIASPTASRLAGGRTGSVGVVVPWITRWFFATVVAAVEATLYQAGWEVLLYNLGGRAHTRRRVLRPDAMCKRVDAAILVAVPLTDEEAAALATFERPGVTVSAGTDVPGWPSIHIDDVAAARTATEHLIALGHTRIAHISGKPSEELEFTTHLRRRKGYQDALRDAGLAPDLSLDVDADLTFAGGARATRELLHRGELPTAIFAVCDEMAMGAIRELRQAGLRVPEDVSVIGIDDHDLAPALGLTTVAQPVAEQGGNAALTVLAPLLGGPRPAATVEYLPTTLVVRDSTAPPARR
jgi:LacI family transcriptional regulator, repressor for deo operon, udp, cdd, tsx, nupC, and nupG